MSSKPLDVLIAGGGIAGLSAAIGFRRAGHRVRILERSHFSDEVGAAITIPPNAVRVLQAWGMDFPKARMINFEGMEVVAGEDEEPRRLHYYDFSASEETFGSPYLLSHRVDLHEALRDIATTEDGDGSPAEIINGSTVVAFDAEAGTVRLAGSELSADLVVAADGIRSTASKFIGYYSPAVPSSTTVIRFLIPTHVIEADPGTKALVAGDGICSIYTMTSRNRWLVRYPCRDNTLQNFAFYSINETNANPTEFTFSCDRQSLVRELQGFKSPIRSMSAKSNEILPLWRCAEREPLPYLHRGKLVLIGDAAHAMLPQLGQGAAQSIEDAAALGALFKEMKWEDSVEERLSLFEEVRRDRVTAIQILSNVPVGDDSLDAVADKFRAHLPHVNFPTPYNEEQKPDVYAYCNSHDVIAECSSLLERRMS